MLKRLFFNNVGPAKSMEIDFLPRLNFLTGDNGLGKSFLLEAAWWAMTGTWSQGPIMPHGAPKNARIALTIQDSAGTPIRRSLSHYHRGLERWARSPDSEDLRGIAIYSRVDGGISICDVARNQAPSADSSRPDAYHFTDSELWDGKTGVIEGVIRDWASWQREGGDEFARLSRVLKALSPSTDEPLIPGRLRRISLNDPRDYPTIAMPYGEDVPVVHASPGIKRILSLAYALVWAWREHLLACELLGEEPTREMTLLVDEVESHLHPRWERRIVPALLSVVDSLVGERPKVSVQIIATTHSPLVLASVEPLFDTAQDCVWELDLNGGEVELKKFNWHRRGDANAWLTSPIFNLESAASLEAESALRDAKALLREENPSTAEAERVHAKLQASLSDIHPFWMRWSAYIDEHPFSESDS